MNFICVAAITEEVARDRASRETGYDPATIGSVKIILHEGDNSRQRTYVFETPNDVSVHALYAKSRLADITGRVTQMEDGPTLYFGPEVTVGG